MNSFKRALTAEGVRFSLRWILSISIALFWACNINEQETLTSIQLTLNDSLSKEAGIYDSIRVDIYDSEEALIYPSIFHGPYVKATDSAKLADLSLGSNPPNEMKVVVTAFKGSDSALKIEIQVRIKSY